MHAHKNLSLSFSLSLSLSHWNSLDLIVWYRCIGLSYTGDDASAVLGDVTVAPTESSQKVKYRDWTGRRDMQYVSVLHVYWRPSRGTNLSTARVLYIVFFLLWAENLFQPVLEIF